MRKQDIIKQCNTKSHLDLAKALNNQPKLMFNTPQTSEDQKSTETELQIAVLTASSCMYH